MKLHGVAALTDNGRDVIVAAETVLGHVREMRIAQRTYFRVRSGENLDRAKACERAVDQALTALEGCLKRAPEAQERLPW